MSAWASDMVIQSKTQSFSDKDNKIKVLKTGTFNSLKRLTELQLNENEIINIEIDADVTLTQKLHEFGTKFKLFIPAR